MIASADLGGIEFLHYERAIEIILRSKFGCGRDDSFALK
jgi:hypothetical protein